MIVVRSWDMSEPPLGYGLTMTPSQRGYEMGQFDWTPEVYLERIRAEVPGYDDLQDQAVAAVPFGPARALELGMGTGETTRRLVEAHPDARRARHFRPLRQPARRRAETQPRSSGQRPGPFAGDRRRLRRHPAR